MKKLLMTSLVLLLFCALCGICVPIQADEIKDFVTYNRQDREMDTFNVHQSQDKQNSEVLCNLEDGLVTNDRYGGIVPAIAQSWSTEDDGKTWTFHLRDDVVWVDVKGEEMAPCVAEDWLWGMEWVLNFHKNQAANTSMLIETVQGAEDYYNYTKSLDEAEALKLGLDKMLEMVGVEAVDEHTLKYTCLSTMPYFPTLGTYFSLYPVSGKLLEKIGVDGYQSVDSETLWYNGPYIMTSFVHMNEKVLEPNPHYYDQEAKRFASVTIKMVESHDVAFQLYQTGEVDNVELTEANLQNIARSESNPYHDQLIETRNTGFSLHMHFNFHKNLADGKPDENWNKAIANENFRLAFYYGMDLTDFLKRLNSLDPMSIANYAYSAPSLIANSQGTDYFDLVMQRLELTPDDDHFVRYDAEKFAEYKQKAMEELEKEGVTFPVQVDHWIKSGNQTQADTATVLKDLMERCLGSDFVTLKVNEFVSSMSEEVLNPGLQSIRLAGWFADYGDPINFLKQETYGDDTAYFSMKVNNINQVDEAEPLVEDYRTFTEMVRKANDIAGDLDARYDAFADAEAYMLKKAFLIPMYYTSHWELTTVNQYSKVYAPYGVQSDRFINWETNDQGFTSEDAQQQKADFEAQRP